MENVKHLTIKNSKGAIVRLEQIAEINEVLGQAVLERTDKLNTIKVTSSAMGRPSGTIVADIQKKLSAIHCLKVSR
jgi:HAE1 family hydrophobic/amphiphilic exporter-1